MKLFLLTASILLLISTLEAKRVKVRTVKIHFHERNKGRKSKNLLLYLNSDSSSNAVYRFSISFFAR